MKFDIFLHLLIVSAKENKNNILSFFGILIFISFLHSFITSSAISTLLFDESSKAFNIFPGSFVIRLGFMALSNPLWII